MVKKIYCKNCGKELKDSGSMSGNDWDIYGEWLEKKDSEEKWINLCPNCYEFETEKQSNLKLIEFIKNKTNKLCITALNITINILEKRLGLKINKELGINKKEAEILHQYCVLVDGEWGSANTSIEYYLMEKLKNYVKKN